MTEQTEIEALGADLVDPPAPEAVPSPEPPVKEWTDDDEKEARAFGWKPPEKWVGEKPEGLIEDPRQFLQGNRGFRILRERTEKLETEFAEKFRRLEAVTTKTVERERAAYQAKLAEIEAAKLDAVTNADREQYDRLEAQRKAMPAPVEFDAAPAAPSVPDEVQEYAKANEWVSNPILREAGAKIIDAMGYAGKPVREQLELAEREVRRIYPHYFTPAAPAQAAPARPAVQRVDGGGLGGGGAGGQFSKLPPEAKAAFARFVSQGVFKETEKETYANDYFN